MRKTIHAAIGRRGSCTQAQLSARLKGWGYNSWLPLLDRLLETDPAVSRANGRIRLDLARAFYDEISAAISSHLTDHPRSWDEADWKVPVLVSRKGAALNFAPDVVKRVGRAMRDQGQLKTLPSGHMVVASPSRLPKVAISTKPFAPERGNVLTSCAARFMGIEVDEVASQIGAALQEPTFRGVRLLIGSDPVPRLTITCAVLDIHSSTTLVVASIGVVEGASRARLEAADWWFWSPARQAPLQHPGYRMYASDFPPGAASLNVLATGCPTTATDGLRTLLRMAAPRISERLVVEFDFAEYSHADLNYIFGSGNEGGSPRGPQVGTCQLCGRPLYNDESARRGYGSICRHKLGPEMVVQGVVGAPLPRVAPAPFVPRSAPGNPVRWLAPMDNVSWDAWRRLEPDSIRIVSPKA